jgi:nitrogen regulatory protein PII
VKMLMIVADAARLAPIQADLRAMHAPGCTVLPVLEGHGRTGVHAGDRVHPGALVMVVVVAESEQADQLYDAMVRRRDEAGDLVTRMFLLPVERQA